MTSRPATSLVGLFVGGHGERLGGVAKGLLKTQDVDGGEITLLERLRREVQAALPRAELLLVGKHASYAHLGAFIEDSPVGIGPLGGLHALLLEARQRGHSHVLVLACDLPFIRRELIERLLVEQPQATALVVETQGVKNPLIARYDSVRGLEAAQAIIGCSRHSLQAVLDRLADVRTLELTDAEARSVRDWDTPEDLKG